MSVDRPSKKTSRALRPSVAHLPPRDDAPPTVLAWLLERFSEVDEATWRSRMARGLVQGEDGLALDAETPYKAHLQVRYFREVDEERVIPFAERIVFEDEHLVVADKPPYLPVTPGGAFVRECLLGRLGERLGDRQLAAVHRLDRATSGLVMFSRRRSERGPYGALFAERRVEKVYEAVALLDPGATAVGTGWTLESRIVSGSPFFRMREEDGSPNSRTEIELVKAWPSGTAASDEALGLFRLRPVTGKTHQLRVHMASLGFGILGDRYYPELQPERPDDFDEPLHLVAKELSFVDPITGAARRFVSSYDVRSLPRASKSSMCTTSSVRSSS